MKTAAVINIILGLITILIGCYAFTEYEVMLSFIIIGSGIMIVIHGYAFSDADEKLTQIQKQLNELKDKQKEDFDAIQTCIQDNTKSILKNVLGELHMANRNQEASKNQRVSSFDVEQLPTWAKKSLTAAQPNNESSFGTADRPRSRRSGASYPHEHGDNERQGMPSAAYQNQMNSISDQMNTHQTAYHKQLHTTP